MLPALSFMTGLATMHGERTKAACLQSALAEQASVAAQMTIGAVMIELIEWHQAQSKAIFDKPEGTTMQHDYFSRPIRSDRNAYGYGHTQLAPEDKRGTIRSLLGIAVLVVIVVLVAAAL